MHEYKVGALYHPQRTRWPEISHLRITPQEMELVLFWNGVTSKDTQALKRGTKDFGIYHQQDQIFWLYRIEGCCDWSDSPFTVHRTPQTERGAPKHDGQRVPLHVLMVEASTGIIKGMQFVTLTPRFMDVLHEALRTQMAAPYDPASYERNLQAVYVRMTSTDLLRRAQITETAGRI